VTNVLSHKSEQQSYGTSTTHLLLHLGYVLGATNMALALGTQCSASTDKSKSLSSNWHHIL